MRRIKQLSLRNYRLFGDTEQALVFVEDKNDKPFKKFALVIRFS